MGKYIGGKYSRYWEMRRGGPKGGPTKEIFKCKDCGAETIPDDGHNGAPDTRKCSDHCPSKSIDWRPGVISDAYRNNYDKIFRKPQEAGHV